MILPSDFLYDALVYNMVGETAEGLCTYNIFNPVMDKDILCSEVAGLVGEPFSIETDSKFDIENNVVYTEVDEPGTYCLMDMEQWFLSLGIFGEDYQLHPHVFFTCSGYI